MRAVSPNLLLLLASCCMWQYSYAAPLSDIDMRIYGGTAVKITEVPFVAEYRFGSYQWCDAVIVHKQFLVTAAQCVIDNQPMVIMVGSDQDTKGVSHHIEKAFRHPKFFRNTTLAMDYDVAVIKLKKELKFNDRVKLIKMADSSKLPNPGDLLKTVGFGRTRKNRSSPHLLKLELPYVDREQCQKVYDHYGSPKVTDRVICAGGDVADKSTCEGDYGGPLIYKDELIGVVSWAHAPCGEKSYPSVFTYIPAVRDFIDKIIKNNS